MYCIVCKSSIMPYANFCFNCGTKVAKPKVPVVVKMYLHGDKDSNYEIGEGIGLSEEAMKSFSHALYEVEFDVEVNIETGEYKILTCDGRKLEDEKVC